MKKNNIILLVVVAIVVIISSWGVSIFNGLVNKDEAVKA